MDINQVSQDQQAVTTLQEKVTADQAALAADQDALQSAESTLAADQTELQTEQEAAAVAAQPVLGIFDKIEALIENVGDAVAEEIKTLVAEGKALFTPK